MGKLGTSDPDSHCIICSASIKFSPDSTNGSSSDLKLANAFLQCLTLDLDYAKDVTSNRFCLQCKLYLEEWDFCQNEIVRLVARSRQLKASLIAKLLESSGQPLPKNHWNVHSNVKLIRQSIKKQFHPRVVLEKTEAPARDFQGRSNCHQGTDSCTGIVQVKQEELNDEILQEYEEKSSPSQLYEYDESRQREDERNPFKLDEEQQNINDNFESPSGKELPLPWTSKPLRKWGKATPLFVSDVIREVHPGVYVYRDKIPFYYENKRFTTFSCGRCKNTIRGGTHNMEKHLRFCENRVIPPGADPKLPLSHPKRSRKYDGGAVNAPKTKRADPTFKTGLIINVKPGEYLYRQKIRVYYKDDRFTCGRCNVVITCKNSNHSSLKRHLSRCERKETPPQNIPAGSQTTAGFAQVHYACHVCGVQFQGADSVIQCQTHMATAHPNSKLHPILPAPPKSSATDPDSSFQQNCFLGLPVAILVPAVQQHDNSTDNGNSSATEEAVGTEDAGLIIPDIMDDELVNVDQMTSTSERDPLQLMKIDIDYPEAKI